MKHFTIFDFIMMTLIILIGLGLGKMSYDGYILGHYIWMTVDIICLFGFCWLASGWIKENLKDKQTSSLMGDIDR